MRQGAFDPARESRRILRQVAVLHPREVQQHRRRFLHSRLLRRLGRRLGRQRGDQGVARIDLQHRRRAVAGSSGAAQQPLHLQVGSGCASGQHHGTVRQPVGGAHIGHLVGQRRLQGDHQRGGVGRLAQLLARCHAVQVGSTLGHAADRLALERGEAVGPEGVDRVGQQQHLDAAGAKALELRRV